MNMSFRELKELSLRDSGGLEPEAGTAPAGSPLEAARGGGNCRWLFGGPYCHSVHVAVGVPVQSWGEPDQASTGVSWHKLRPDLG